MMRAVLALAAASLGLVSVDVMAQTTDTTAPTEQRLAPVTQVDNPNEGPATRDSPPVTPVAPTTPAPSGPRGTTVEKKKASPAAQTPLSPPRMGVAEFVVQHVLMGVLTAFVGVVGLVLLGAAVFLLLPVALGPLSESVPDPWRRGAGILILGGILPGVLMALIGGVAITAYSAVTNRSAVTERGK